MIAEYLIITTLFISNIDDRNVFTSTKAEETPTKQQAVDNINDILKIARESVNNKREDLDIYFHFPLMVTSASDDSNKLKRKVELYTSEDLKRNYEKVLNPTNIKLINCLNEKNLIYNRYKGFSAAFGGIWFTARYVGNDVKYKISSITTDIKTTEKWILNNCNK